MKLTFIIATRERPFDLVRTLNAVVRNMTREDTTLLLCVDADDKQTINALDTIPNDRRIRISVKEREDSRGEKYDRALTEAPADVYLVGHDCVPLNTVGFDDLVVRAAESFPDGIGCVYSPMANMSFPSMQAPTARLVEKIGYIYSHEYPFWFIDHELDDIVRMIGRYVFVNIEQDIATRRPSKTLRLRELKFWTTYFDIATMRRRNLAHSIIDGEDFLEPQWRKDMLKTWHHLIEIRSHWLNAQVRGAAEQIERERGEKGPPDEGYVRLRTAAEKRMIEMYEELKAA
jgi:hypothetical protein